MVLFIEEKLGMIRFDKVLEYRNILMVLDTQVNGLMISLMVVVNFIILMVIYMMVNGKIIKLMEKVHIHIEMVANI